MSETSDQLEIFREKAQGTNVNSVTLLATDYLNHFNEALMLAELVVDMPDMLDDLNEWAPRHYKDHFRESGIADRELAIDAYDVSPPEYRAYFDRLVSQLNRQIQLLQKDLGQHRAQLEDGSKKEFVLAKCGLIRELIDRAGGTINGHLSEDGVRSDTTPTPTAMPTPTTTPTATKTPVRAEEESDGHESDVISQSDIDALFD